jgi:hypothetical protein
MILTGRFNFSKILAAVLRYRIYPAWYAGSGWFLEHSLIVGIHYEIR